MANSANSTWPRIIFVLAVLVFLGAVGWAVNSAVIAYESYRQRSAEAAKPAKAEKPGTDRPASAAPHQPPAAPAAPQASGSQRPVASRMEAERARIEKVLAESMARLEAEVKAASEGEPAAESSEPLRAGGTVTPPVRIGGPDPDYTAAALAQRVQGVVVIEAVIETDGRVSSTRVLHGVDPGLDEAARAAVEQWQFAPALQDGEPVRVYYTLSIDFRLR